MWEENVKQREGPWYGIYNRQMRAGAHCSIAALCYVERKFGLKQQKKVMISICRGVAMIWSKKLRSERIVESQRKAREIRIPLKSVYKGKVKSDKTGNNFF